MCGIAGISLRPGRMIDPGIPARLAEALAHRGPDGHGTFATPDATLVHTRLAIIDLLSGEQPLKLGPLTIVANGEIYNYQQLRQSLRLTCATDSDCEPPLHVFAYRAEMFPAALRGMYGIAIHDAACNTVTLSRDPFGIKPLYVTETSSGITFASQPSALLFAGLAARQLDHARLIELLELQFTTGRRTVFTGIDRLAPGETLTIRDGAPDAAGKISPWQLPSLPPPPSEEVALDRLDAVLEDAVDLHLRADVPYGMFLSGGIDSAAILAMTHRLSSRPILAFTAGFESSHVADERAAAAAAAAAANAIHRPVVINEAMVWRHLPEIVAAMDDPAADYAIIPSWFLAREARADVKVILSGEGGDEIFAGYGRYRAAARTFFPKPMRARGIFDGLGLLRAGTTGWRDGLAATETGISDPSRLRAAQRADIADWLPHNLLLKLDRCLMAHGVEGRTPYVDTEVARFAFSLPDALLLRRGQGKYLLRLWLQKHLPAARPFARKQGFDVPIGAWIAKQGRRLGPLVAAAPIIAELAEAHRVEGLFARAADKRAGFAAWLLLFVALWHRHHILDLPKAGDVFETLASR